MARWQKTMWDVEVRKILDFAIQQILERQLKLKKVNRRPALRCGERKGEWNLRKEERKKTRGLRGEYVDACIHSFFHSSFLARNLEINDSIHSTNTWITPWRELTTGDVTTGPVRRKCKNISVICFYHFLCLSPRREMGKVGKDLRKENSKLEKKYLEKLTKKQIRINDRRTWRRSLEYVGW